MLDIIKKNFTDIRTKRLVNKLYKKYNEGFYVDAKRDLTNIKQATTYIGRYLARPAIVEYRVSRYNDKSVTFWYENKKTRKKITVIIARTQWALLQVRQPLQQKWKYNRNTHSDERTRF